MPLKRTGCRQDALIFKAGDDIRPAPATVFPFLNGLECLEAARQNNRTGFDPHPFCLLCVGLSRDSPGFARRHTLHAFAASPAVKAAGGLFAGGFFTRQKIHLIKARQPFSHRQGQGGHSFPDRFIFRYGRPVFPRGRFLLPVGRQFFALQVSGDVFGGSLPGRHCLDHRGRPRDGITAGKDARHVGLEGFGIYRQKIPP